MSFVSRINRRTFAWFKRSLEFPPSSPCSIIRAERDFWEHICGGGEGRSFCCARVNPCANGMSALETAQGLFLTVAYCYVWTRPLLFSESAHTYSTFDISKSAVPPGKQAELNSRDISIMRQYWVELGRGHFFLILGVMRQDTGMKIRLPP